MAAATPSSEQRKITTPLETLPFQILKGIRNNHPGPRRGQLCDIRLDLQDRNYHFVEYADGFTQRRPNDGSIITQLVDKHSEPSQPDAVDDLAEQMSKSLMISRQQLTALKTAIDHLKQGGSGNLENQRFGQQPKSGLDALCDQIVGLSLSQEGKNASSDAIVNHVSNDLSKVAAFGGIDELINKLQHAGF